MENLIRDKEELNKFYYIIYRFLVLPFENYPPKTCARPITEEEIIKAHEESNKRTSLYFHIPFCAQACKFCNCCKVSKFTKEDMFVYVDKALLSFDRFVKNIDTKFISVWFGGGTPLILPDKLLEKVLLKISDYVDANTQIIIESTPAGVTENKAILMDKYNVSRVTVGVQTFNEKLLKYNKRIQSTKEIVEKVGILRKYNFNINIDLMVGLTNQTIDMFKEDLKKAMELKPDQIHLNAFTTFEAHDCSEEEIDKKLVLRRERMILIGKKILNNDGYHRQGSEAFVRTNSIANALSTSHIFENSDIIAIGDTSGGHVYKKLHYLTRYTKDGIIYKAVRLTKDIEMERYIALHLLRGLDKNKFNVLFNTDFQKKYKKTLTVLLKKELLTMEGSVVRFNKKIGYSNLLEYYLIVKLFWSDASKSYVFNNALEFYMPKIDYSKKALKRKVFYDDNFIQEKNDTLH